MTTSTTHRARNKILKTLAVAAFWLLLWQLASVLVHKSVLLASPLQVLQSLVRLAGTSAFWRAAAGSLLKIAAGYFASIALAVILAVGAAKSAVVNTLVTPLMRTVNAIPVASITILVFFWLSSALVPTVITCLTVIPLLYRALYTAIIEVDEKLLQMAKVFGVKQSKVIKHIYMPLVLPQFLAACGTALGFAWKAGISAEIISLPANSIGLGLYSAKIYLENADLLAWTVVIVALSFVMERALARVLKKAAPAKKGGE